MPRRGLAATDAAQHFLLDGSPHAAAVPGLGTRESRNCRRGLVPPRRLGPAPRAKSRAFPAAELSSRPDAKNAPMQIMRYECATDFGLKECDRNSVRMKFDRMTVCAEKYVCFVSFPGIMCLSILLCRKMLCGLFAGQKSNK